MLKRLKLIFLEGPSTDLFLPSPSADGSNYPTISTYPNPVQTSGQYVVSLIRIVSSNIHKSNAIFSLKGIVSVISSDPICKDDNARFTMVHLTALQGQVWIRDRVSNERKFREKIRKFSFVFYKPFHEISLFFSKMDKAKKCEISQKP